MPILLLASSEVLVVTDQFTYLASTITNNLSLNRKIDKRIAKTASVLAKLSKRVWDNNQLTLNTKLKVYRARVLSIPLYGKKSWMTYATQENRLECLHLRCLRRILGITWQDKVTNAAVLEQDGTLSMYLLRQRRLQWLGHVHRMKDGRIPKDILYGELATGHRPESRSVLQARSETYRHRPRQLGTACRRQQWLAPRCSRRCQEGRGI